MRDQLQSGLTANQIFDAAGKKRVYWLTALEEEARLAGELGTFPKTPESVIALRDQRQLRWERIAARVFGEAQRVTEVRNLYDQAHGPGASARSYTGRGRRFPEMSPDEPDAPARAQPNATASGSPTNILVSPRGVAHFPNCPHKGDDLDYSDWAELDLPQAWQRIGNGEHLRATSAERGDLIATSRCQTCVAHGPW